MGAADWSLPTETEFGGQVYPFNSDFRDILEIIGVIQTETDTQMAALSALALFYEDIFAIPTEHWQAALEYLYGFIACFEEDDGRPQPKNFDWEQDYTMIAADVNKVARCEVRALPHLHWFTFIGYFTSIGDGQLVNIVSIRQKLRKRQKLDKWEQEFYRNNKARVDLKVKYTPEEQEEIDRLNERLGR
ncbi:Gp15 family bacteriophage protein [Ruminococcaceae bacterium OttesenSCG-928-A11]|nr:Gp15 family bacteriophage protein [Ruminococcaceae bacterium OttesenSCG-928-A11]